MPVIDVEYDIGGGTTPAAAVVDAVSLASRTDPVDLPHVYDVIDPEALDRLLNRSAKDSEMSECVVSFTFDGWNVFVRDDGRIRVCDPAEPTTPSPIFD